MVLPTGALDRFRYKLNLVKSTLDINPGELGISDSGETDVLFKRLLLVSDTECFQSKLPQELMINLYLNVRYTVFSANF